jgi:hypothetical protein
VEIMSKESDIDLSEWEITSNKKIHSYSMGPFKWREIKENEAPNSRY